MANINNFEQFKIEFTKANSLNKAKLAMQYPDYMSFMLREQLAIEGKIPGTGIYNKATKKVEQFKKAIDTKAKQAKESVDNTKKVIKNNVNKAATGVKQTVTNTVDDLAKNAVSMEQALAKEGLKKSAQAGAKAAASAGVKSAAKAGVGSVLGPVVSGALALPTAVKGLTDNNANALTRAYDLLGLGSAVGIAAAPGLLKIPALAGSVLFPMASDAMRNNNGEGTPDINNNSLKPLTPEERNKIANNTNNLLQQAQQQSNEMQDAINWYDNYNNRMNANLQNEINNTSNLRPPAQPLSYGNTSGNTKYPITNLTPINGQPNVAKQNTNNKMVNNNMATNNNINFNNGMNNLLNNIQAISAYTKGVQQGNQLPNLGVSPEELTAYQRALEVYGNNVSQANKDIEAYKQALLRDQKVNSMIRMMGSAGNVISNLKPKQNMYTFDWRGNFVGTGAPDATNYNDAVDRALKTPGMSDRIRQQYELNEMMRKNEADNANRFADLLANARVSNATGLPIQVVKGMEAGDYLDYIQPVQDRATKAQELALTGVNNLVRDNQQQDADFNKAMAVANMGYTTEQLKQLNENQRAVLDANLKAQMNALDNTTKIKAMQLAGYNAQQLERLRQTDPNAYLRAQGQILQAAALYGGQVGALGQNMLFNIFNNMNGTNTQPVSQSDAVNSYIQNVFK